ncbi:SIMPL domain-containing protein [Pseudorhodobacter sp.]|uniref:SIMPL domain-containing protein n=1 Tax=Pseudorhodobacter sp. TaxID=1934400 RepID=UPI0026476302|nr:SIMPL domain-containing protein [Pseudorhodobacter sp.]MDN5787395.1 SIMPL domain-containing protein [Pseudorhodobacter sp.]
MRVHKTLILTALLALTVPALAGAQAIGNPQPSITITGEGMVEVKPDMATISLGVTTTAKTATEAMAANSAQLSTVLTNLKAAGVADKDLQTSGLSLQPNWNNRSYASGSGNEITGYTASNQISVRVRDLSQLGGLLDAAITDGVNTLNGVTFGLTAPDPVLDAARKAAVANARHRAELLAEAAGVKLGSVVTISENGSYNPQPQYKGYASAVAESVPVEAGALNLTASVTVVWALAP